MFPTTFPSWEPLQATRKVAFFCPDPGQSLRLADAILAAL
jgi:hypothetical protein